MTRRSWLLGLSGAAISAHARPAPPDDGGDDAAIEAVRAAADAAGIGRATRVRSTRRYVGVGNAPEAFVARAVPLCEELATDYLAHFKKKGLPADEPRSRMVVVLLDSPQAFSAFLKVPMDRAVGGVYDLDTNRLVVFDNRARGGDGPNERANSVALFHEATHQLTYNTGLLDRRGDVPVAISEGLAQYGEVRRPNGSTKVGAANPLRLAEVGAGPWIGSEALLTTDALFDGDRRPQADGHAWLLVHHLMTTPARLGPLRAYLDAIRPRRDESRRVDDARATLGDLDALDAELKKAARRR